VFDGVGVQLGDRAARPQGPAPALALEALEERDVVEAAAARGAREGVALAVGRPIEEEPPDREGQGHPQAVDRAGEVRVRRELRRSRCSAGTWTASTPPSASSSPPSVATPQRVPLARDSSALTAEPRRTSTPRETR